MKKLELNKKNYKNDVMTFAERADVNAVDQPPSRHPDFHQDDVKAAAFTLAEVLITLGIIGIVAAMTISTLIKKYEEKATVVKVKRAYAIFNEALKLAIAEYGEVDKWGIGTSLTSYTAETDTEFFNYLRPYIRISKDIGTSGEGLPTDVVYKQLNGNNHVNYYTQPYYKFYLADGSLIWLRTHYDCSKSDGCIDNVCALVWYDTNGTKGPNQIGHDTFAWYITREKILSSECKSDDCKLTHSGFACAEYIIRNGNMNYLHE